MKSLIEDPLEFVKQSASNNVKTVVYKPRHCDFCNRLFIPFKNEHIRSVRNFCHVCYELLYPNSGRFIDNDWKYRKVPSRRTPVYTKEMMWVCRVQLYREITHREFPYHKKFKYFEEPASRLKKAESVYRELMGACQKAKECKCNLCGELFQRKTPRNTICPKCRWFFGNRTIILVTDLAKGKCTRHKVEQLIKDKLEDLDEDTRNRILKGEFDFTTEARTLSDINRERAEILENLEKHQIPEPRIVRCPTCWKLLTSQTDQKNGRCQACIDLSIPPEERWFKGIVGLSKRSLEDIAKLPSYCHEVYTQHMSEEELAQFRIILAPIKRQATLRRVAQGRIRFTHDE